LLRNLPAAHGTHTPPGSPAKPRLHAHAVASLEPAGAAALAPHAMQAAASSAACCALTVPAGQAVQLFRLKLALKVPTGHAWHVRDTVVGKEPRPAQAVLQ